MPLPAPARRNRHLPLLMRGAADMLPTITRGAVEDISVRGTDASATVRGHTTTDPYASADTVVSSVVTLMSAGGRWLIC